jgi:hypothetical protein
VQNPSDSNLRPFVRRLSGDQADEPKLVLSPTLVEQSDAISTQHIHRGTSVQVTIQERWQRNHDRWISLRGTFCCLLSAATRV